MFAEEAQGWVAGVGLRPGLGTRSQIRAFRFASLSTNLGHVPAPAHIRGSGSGYTIPNSCVSLRFTFDEFRSCPRPYAHSRVWVLLRLRRTADMLRITTDNGRRQGGLQGVNLNYASQVSACGCEPSAAPVSQAVEEEGRHRDRRKL